MGAQWQRSWLKSKSNPLIFVTDVLGVTPEPWQAEALVAVGKHDRVSIRSGHGVGKTTLQAWLVLWFLLTHQNCKVPVAANSQDQLRDTIWPISTAARRKPKPTQRGCSPWRGPPHREQHRQAADFPHLIHQSPTEASESPCMDVDGTNESPQHFRHGALERSVMQSIQTFFNGRWHRSRLEARYAFLLQACGLTYHYEREGFDLARGKYLPDFWLPTAGIWLEVKGWSPSTLEQDQCQHLADETKRRVVIIRQQFGQLGDVRADAAAKLTFHATPSPL